MLVLFAVFSTVCTIVLCATSLSERLDITRFPLQGLIAGLLTLIGFITTSRTFLVFKMTDSVYSDPKWQADRRKLIKGTNAKPNDPLRRLDEKFLATIYVSFFVFVLVLFFAAVFTEGSANKFAKPLGCLIVASTLGCLLQLAICVFSMNKNLSFIIDETERIEIGQEQKKDQ